MQVFSNARFSIGLPPGHRFPMPKYELLRDRVEAELTGIRLTEADGADDDALALVHSPDYIAAVVQGTLSAAAQREIGFPWSERMVERSRRSVGATIAAARAALAEGVACHLAGGTHHAYADKGSGFCVFNDVAVAARLMQAEHLVRGQRADHRAVLPAEALAGPPAEQAAGPQARARPLPVWVIDLDVHQGNGTAAIFRDDPDVFTLSLHGAKNFPFRKEPGDLDVDLPDGCTDEPYLAALDAALDDAWRRQLDRGARPGLAFYLAGADPHEDDRLGRLKLSAWGLAERDRRVFAFLNRQRVPVAVTMAGGYGRDIAVTVAVQLTTVRWARQAWAAWQAGDSLPDGLLEESGP